MALNLDTYKQMVWSGTRSFTGAIAGLDKEDVDTIRLRVVNVMVDAARREPGGYEKILSTPSGCASIHEALSKCLETGLYPGSFQPDAWLVPRAENGTSRLQWQASARGMASLVERAGYTLSYDLIYEGDDALVIHPGGVIERKVTADWRPSQTGNLPIFDLGAPRGALRDDLSPLVGVVVVARKGAELVGWRWCSRAEIAKRKAVSRTPKVWNSWREEMVVKTAMIYAVSRGICPRTTEMRAALEGDSDAVDVDAVTVTPTPTRAALPETTVQPPALPDHGEGRHDEFQGLTNREKVEIMAEEAGMALAEFLGSRGWTRPASELSEADAARFLQ